MRFPVLLMSFILVLPLAAQWREQPETGSQPERLDDRTTLAGQSGLAPSLSASLADPHGNARQHRAVVQVETEGIRLVSQAGEGTAPKLDEGHLQYRLDSSAPLESTSTSMQFDNLSPGEHHIQVMLVGNDNRPAGPSKTLTISIP